jgi:sarcosine oxidase delta subunit
MKASKKLTASISKVEWRQQNFFKENPQNFHHNFSGRHTQGCSILLSHRRPNLRSQFWSEGFLEPNCEEICGNSNSVNNTLPLSSLYQISSDIHCHLQGKSQSSTAGNNGAPTSVPLSLGHALYLQHEWLKKDVPT